MIYIGKFLHLTNQQKKEESDRRHGEFDMMAEAETPEAAVDMFRERILQYREYTDFFEGQCLIYLIQLQQIHQLPDQQALMMSYKTIAGDPLMPYISCIRPSEEAHACRILEWEGKQPEIDGHDAEPFMKFQK